MRPVRKCLFRLKKAIDLVDHRILLSKVSVCLNSSNSLPFSCSYLKNIVPCVFLRGSYSSGGTVIYGVPQGSVLGPVLFCSYINYLPLHTPSHSAECHMLADDTTHQTTGKKHCANSEDATVCLDRISEWCYTSHMLINHVKTKSMVITIQKITSTQTYHSGCHWMVRILKL